MKKIGIIILTLMMAVSITGCKKNAVTAKFAEDLKWDEEKGQYVNEKNAKLSIWLDNEEYGDKLIELWKEKYPDVELTYEKRDINENVTKLKLDGPAGLGSDVFYMPHNAVVDAREAGLLFELPERDKKVIMETMQESSYKVTMYEGNMYAVPDSVENIALAYNKQILAALPALPTVLNTTASNLLEQLENKQIYLEELFAGIANWGNTYAGTGVEIPYLTDRFYTAEVEGEAGSEDKHTIMAWQLYDAYHNYPLLTRNGYRVFGEDNNDPTKFNMTSKEVTDAIKAVTGDWYGNKDGSKLFPGLATIQDIVWDQGPSRFQKGQVAITITGPWVMTDIKANWKTWVEEGRFGITEDTKVSDIYGVTEIPKFSNDQNPVTFSGVRVTGINIYTNYPNASMNLLEFLTSEDVMKEAYSILGRIPTVKNSDNIPGLNEDAISQGFLSQAVYSHPMPVIQEGNYMWDPLRDVWTNIFDEGMSIEEAQEKAQGDYERILRDSGK